ncbi:alpha/beta hydrolase [Rhodococcus olei]|uniref:alpha/beta hydrolase n=1 Tax=Rhodococcus olei TaxID=2161675 RepID=UPI0031E9811C
MPDTHALLSSLSRLSLVGPVATATVALVGAVALVVLLVAARRSSRRALGIAGAAAVAGTLGAAGVVWAVGRPLPLQLSEVGIAAVAVAVAGTCAAGAAVASRRGRPVPLSPGRVIGADGAVAVVAAAALSVTAVVVVNRDTGRYPTLGSVVGHRPPAAVQFVDFDAVPGPQHRVLSGTPVARVWRPPLRATRDGLLTHVTIPGARSGFAARPALVYLPPAYLDSPRPLLPVLVLVAGNPGKPDDWLGIGLADIVSRFAAAHQGLAPVVIVPDALGADDAVPLCLDSRLGNVQTYLAADVPAWAAENLQVDADPRAWAIGGYSYGGTCAVQLAVNRPDVYPTFLDISGQDEPSLGDHTETVAATYGGDERAFAAVSARDELTGGARPAAVGVFVAGEDDDEYRPQQQRMYAAAAAAGMDVRYYELPGPHSGRVWTPAFARELDWIAVRTGLLAP